MTTVADIITRVGYRVMLDQTAIASTGTTPVTGECIAWINEWTGVLERLCMRYGSEMGRTTGSISAVDGTASYSTITDLLAPAIMYDKYGNPFCGWIEKTSTRVPLQLTTLAERIHYQPGTSNEGEPEKWYLDESSNIIFLPTPDDSYTVYIPYYKIHAALTATTDTMPFDTMFDDTYVQFVTNMALNREEYELKMESAWIEALERQAIQLILTRKNPLATVTS